MGRIKLEQVKPNQLTKLRDINQKLFPILSISDSSDEFSDIFADEDRGFAFIAYYSDMTVRSSIGLNSKFWPNTKYGICSGFE